jgi:hypothetical protein
VSNRLPSQNSSNDQFSSSLRLIFIQFFSSCGHRNGFVFKKADRERMIKEENKPKKKNLLHKKIKWNAQCACWV